MAKQELISFDWAIKRILRQKANFGILNGFLSVLLGEDVKIDRILESESNQENESDKFNKVDILVQNAQEEWIFVELQYESEMDYFHRMAYGASKLVSESINMGDKYGQIKKVISVNIVYFNLGQGDDYVYHGKTEFRGMHTQDVLRLSENQRKSFKKDHVHLIFPEYYILKVNKFNDMAKDSLDEWVYFLKNNRIESSFSAPGLLEANEVLNALKMNVEEYRRYRRYLENKSYKASMEFTWEKEHEFALEKAHNTGMEKGMGKANLETARALKKLGIATEIIAQSTGLSETEIEQL